ncbi:MAG: DUF2281 domain-containing protein [Nostocaceae cyanobacterium]|nr:DUF2281 domain-containing protein [Nostocaceae cyanobacterium]
MMTAREQAIAKIHQIPESLIQEVSDFIDFLVWKHSGKESLVMAEFY